MTEHSNPHPAHDAAQNGAQHGAQNPARIGGRHGAPLLVGAAEFAAVVLGDRTGVVCLAFGRGPHRTATGSYAHLDWQEMCYPWPAERNVLLADVAREIAVAPVDVYVCPAVRHAGARARRKGDALPPLVCWADLDREPADPALLAMLRRLGAFTVRSGTSAHRHVYLPLSRPVDLATHALLNQALAARLAGDAKWSDETLLRLPGTPNWKPTAPASGQPGGRPVLVTADPHNAHRLDPDQLAALLNLDLSATAASGGPQRVQDAPAVTPEPAPQVLPEVVARALADPDIADRSRAIARVIAACVTGGLSAGQTLTVISRYGPAARYTQPRHMTADVARFYAKVTADRANGTAGTPAPHQAPPATPASAGHAGGSGSATPTNGHRVLARPARPPQSASLGPGHRDQAAGEPVDDEQRPEDLPRDVSGDPAETSYDIADEDIDGENGAETGEAGCDPAAVDHGHVDVHQPDAGPDLHMLAATVFQLSGDVSSFHTRLQEVEEQVNNHADTFDKLEVLGAAMGGLAEPVRSLQPPQPAPPSSSTDPPDQPGNGHAPTGAQAPGAAGLDMRALVRWVGDNVAALLERKMLQSGGWPYWCRRWWMHPEAIARFEAARRCWAEAVTAEGAAMVVYFEHLDAMLAVLCADNGPFCSCTNGQHRADQSETGVRILGQDPPPEDYYTSLSAPLDTADAIPHAAAARPDGARPLEAAVSGPGGRQLAAAPRSAEVRHRVDRR